MAVPEPADDALPLVGTGGHGHTYPGATVPFGYVQVSPDTRTEGWDACSGYHYTDSSIMGFSHTHLSGTGCADLGDLLITPVAGTWAMRRWKPSGFSLPFRTITKQRRPATTRSVWISMA